VDEKMVQLAGFRFGNKGRETAFCRSGGADGIE
jgi:hypothetical protein